mmetsp:Transcript_45587/g.127058  ORF Transcript_45587/g.127058 Transcript_45587/m.127058 type:complete len:325 (+) Transcript_45587:724-1698(+)
MAWQRATASDSSAVRACASARPACHCDCSAASAARGLRSPSLTWSRAMRAARSAARSTSPWRATRRRSPSAAARLSATDWIACNTVCRYSAAAASRCAQAARSRAARVPPSNNGWVSPPVKLQKRLLDWNSCDSVDEACPTPDAVMLKVGRRLARATPTSALAERRLASAARTSGRVSTSRAGTAVGSSAGRRSSARLKLASSGSTGYRPSKARSRCPCCASWRSSVGRLASRLASCSCWALSSASEAAPSRRRRCVISSACRWVSIWPRTRRACSLSPATLMAASTTLAATVSRVADRFSAATSRCAVRASTLRRGRPNPPRL